MDIAGTWRNLHPDTAEVPRAGIQHAAPAEDITITVTQQCQVALPRTNLQADEVTVTVTSNRPGAAAQVNVGANLNSQDGHYQGPTTGVGQGQFTAQDSQFSIGFVVLPTDPWPVLGVGAEAIWADGSTPSNNLTYVQIPCRNQAWWWWWILHTVIFLNRLFPVRR